MWLDALIQQSSEYEYLKNVQKFFICTAHFTPNCISNQQPVRLHNWATPTIFVNNDSIEPQTKKIKTIIETITSYAKNKCSLEIEQISEEDLRNVASEENVDPHCDEYFEVEFLEDRNNNKEANNDSCK